MCVCNEFPADHADAAAGKPLLHPTEQQLPPPASSPDPAPAWGAERDSSFEEFLFPVGEPCSISERLSPCLPAGSSARNLCGLGEAGGGKGGCK